MPEKRKAQRLAILDSSSDDGNETPLVSPSSSPHRTKQSGKPRLNLSKSISKVEIDPDFDVTTENDDAQERKNRRRSRMVENQIANLLSSPAQSNRTENMAKRQPELFTGMNNDQVAEHYSNCIKLAAENKITSKNAFNLHLIDYMTHILNQDDIQNFQVASSSLDAGAKIYAGRVDAVHQDTYKVLTGLGRTEKPGAKVGDGANSDGGGAGNMDGDSDEEDADKRKKNKDVREKKRKNFVVKSLAKIRQKTINLQFDMDPLFQQQAAAYDEGGTGELRLNHIHVLNGTSELLLDSSTQVVGRQLSDNNQEEVESDIMVDTNTFLDTFNVIRGGRNGEAGLTLGRTFINFKFVGWDKEIDDIGDSLMRSQNQTQLAAAFDLTNIENGEVADLPPADDDDSFHSAGGSIGGDDMVPPPPLDDDDIANTTVYIGESKEAFVNGSSHIDPSIDGSTFVTCLRDMLSRQLDEFGDFNDNLLGMWAGPSHWKKKAKFTNMLVDKRTQIIDANQSPTSTNTKSTGDKKKVSRKKPEATVKYEANENSNKNARYSRIIKIDWGPIFRHGKASTTLSDPTLHKNMKKKYLMQQSNMTHKDGIFQLMTREIALRTDRGLLQKCREAELDEVQLGEYDFNNENDVAEFCPLSQGADGGNDGIPFMEVDDDDDDYNFDAGNPFEEAPGNWDDDEKKHDPMDLVAEPRKIAKIDIGYAKAAKRINVKQLKRAMWTYLTNDQQSGTTAATPADLQTSILSSTIIEGDTTAGRSSLAENFVKECKSLLGVVKEIPKKVPRQTACELSVPIILTCLLYLANEKDLFLESSEDLNDIKITQGLVEHQIETVKPYQSNLNKKKRSDSAANKTQQHLDNWLNMEDDS